MLFLDKLGTVEPPNKAHIGPTHFVHCREVILFSEACKCVIAIGNHTFETFEVSL